MVKITWCLVTEYYSVLISDNDQDCGNSHGNRWEILRS